MRHRYLVSLAALAGCVALLSLTASLAGQSGGAKAPAKAAASKAAPAPKTPWGDPDLQGTWFVLYGVPLERPAQYANKQFLTDEEVAALDKQKEADPGRNARASGAQDVSGAYNAVFNS